MYPHYGWSPRGERLFEAVPFQRGKNLSVLGAFGVGGMIATFQKEGSIKRADLEIFLSERLLPLLATGSFRRPRRKWSGSVLVMDNARTHHGGKIASVVEGAGCHVLYLPAYSPDLNPIELAWGWIKRIVRGLSPRDVVSRVVAIEGAIASLPAVLGKSWFRKTGLQC